MHECGFQFPSGNWLPRLNTSSIRHNTKLLKIPDVINNLVLFSTSLLLILVLAACSSIGPRTVPNDQFDYNAAIAEAEREQLLTNLVRMRYSETPTFLTVSSVISQYSRSASASANAGVNTAISGEDSAGVRGGVIWADRPTITYVPVSGRKFSENLLTPLPPAALFGMMQSGWPADIVFRVSIWSINDLDNDLARPSRRRQGEADLYEMLRVWARLREAGAMGIRETSRTDVPETVTLFLRPDLTLESREAAARFRELLGIPADATEFPLSYGLVPADKGEIAVLTGSFGLADPGATTDAHLAATIAIDLKEAIPVLPLRHFLLRYHRRRMRTEAYFSTTGAPGMWSTSGINPL